MGWVRIGPGWVGPMDNSEVEATRNKQAYAQRDSPGGDTAAREGGGSVMLQIARAVCCRRRPQRVAGCRRRRRRDVIAGDVIARRGDVIAAAGSRGRRSALHGARQPGAPLHRHD